MLVPWCVNYQFGDDSVGTHVETEREDPCPESRPGLSRFPKESSREETNEQTTAEAQHSRGDDDADNSEQC
jgi:hypothetical protein